MGSSWAAAESVYTWEDCLREARAHNPDLVSAREKLNQAKGSKAVTRSGALPQISGSLSESTSKSTDHARTDTYDYGVSAKQLLFDGFKTTYDIKSAQQNVNAAAYNYAVVSSNVRLNLRTAFINLLDSQESLKVFQTIAQRRKQNLDLVTLRYQGGGEHKGSLLTAEANWEQAQSDVAQAKRNIELSQRRLAKAMGWENFTPVIAKGEFNVTAIDRTEPVYEAMIATVPLLQQLVALKEAARLGVKSAQADFYPKIYANAGAGRSDGSWPPKQTDWSFGFSLTVPLFEGGLQQAQLSKAKSALGQAQADERSGRDGVILTLADTWTQWQNGADDVRVQKKFLEAAQERAKIAEAEYTSGLVSFNDWTIIEDNLVNSQKSLLNVEANALIAEANWIQAKGETLDE